MLNDLLKEKNVAVFGAATKEYTKGTIAAFNFPVTIVLETSEKYFCVKN